MVIGLGFGVPVIAVGLYPLALGVVGFIASQGTTTTLIGTPFSFWVVSGWSEESFS